MDLVVGLDFCEQGLGDVGFNLIREQRDDVAVVVDSGLLFWALVDVDVVFALLFADHLDLFHFYLQFVLFLFFGVFDHLTALLLRLGGLFFDLGLDLRRQLFPESQQL